MSDRHDLTSSFMCAACRVLVPRLQIYVAATDRLSDATPQSYAHFQNGDITVLAHTHCALPCAILHF